MSLNKKDEYMMDRRRELTTFGSCLRCKRPEAGRSGLGEFLAEPAVQHISNKLLFATSSLFIPGAEPPDSGIRVTSIAGIASSTSSCTSSVGTGPQAGDRPGASGGGVISVPIHASDCHSPGATPSTLHFCNAATRVGVASVRPVPTPRCGAPQAYLEKSYLVYVLSY